MPKVRHNNKERREGEWRGEKRSGEEKRREERAVRREGGDGN